ncbi:MAG TPA: FAD binding domain-containing protein, partial [Candidatus Bathyarchaeia archaeon]|nr:FAD binding domain-containing protein [Candidatus Bathyarchaeia archaeon]
MTLRFAAPASLEEALALLAADATSRPVAGGTDLVVAARQGRKPLPESIVAIDRIAELSHAGIEDGDLVLGGLVSHAWLAASPEVGA